jgi:cation transport ATPase
MSFSSVTVIVNALRLRDMRLCGTGTVIRLRR